MKHRSAWGDLGVDSDNVKATTMTSCQCSVGQARGQVGLVKLFANDFHTLELVIN